MLLEKIGVINLTKQKTNKNVRTGSKPVHKNKSIRTGSKPTSKKKKNKGKIIKWVSLTILTIGAIALFLLSDLFNIKEIKVIDNNKISKQMIINLSELKTNENMFKFLKIKVVESIKTNPYIETVEIHRKLNRNSRN